MNPYSPDLRWRIVRAHQEGEGSVRELAERFDVSARTVQRYLTCLRTTGSLLPKAYRHGPRRLLRVSHLGALRSLLKDKNDRTDAEMAEALEQRTGLLVSSRTINRTWQRLGVTRKKKR